VNGVNIKAIFVRLLRFLGELYVDVVGFDVDLWPQNAQPYLEWRSEPLGGADL
jgi:hypothetical protein